MQGRACFSIHLETPSEHHIDFNIRTCKEEPASIHLEMGAENIGLFIRAC